MTTLKCCTVFGSDPMDDALTTVASGSIQVNIFAESTTPILPVKIICNASDHFKEITNGIRVYFRHDAAFNKISMVISPNISKKLHSSNFKKTKSSNYEMNHSPALCQQKQSRFVFMYLMGLCFWLFLIKKIIIITMCRVGR